LEKDNPVAPQPYAGPRRRQERSRKSVPARAGAQGEMGRTLLTLMEAAERFVNGAARSKKLEAERNALLDAITQAQWLLSVEQIPAQQAAERRKRNH
jgi:hypothetical protein